MSGANLLIITLFVLAAAIIYGIYRLSNDGDDGLGVVCALFGSLGFLVGIVSSFAAPMIIEHEKIGQNDIEFCKTANHAIVFHKNKDEMRVFETHHNYKETCREADFYLEKSYNSWGFHVDDKIILEHEK